MKLTSNFPKIVLETLIALCDSNKDGFISKNEFNSFFNVLKEMDDKSSTLSSTSWTPWISSATMMPLLKFCSRLLIRTTTDLLKKKSSSFFTRTWVGQSQS